ncbi:MAG: hypothetical protein IPJ51_10150 [Saprospiraceae bacterium]|nr:hypothetical protein [Saprospiraceae bacterium]
MLTYLLQSSTCLIILYGIYHFILSEMTFFKYNRAYLLLSILASLMIPILAPLLVLPEESVPVLHWSHIAGDITFIVADNAVTVFDWKGLIGNILWVVYFVGVMVVLLKMIYGLSRIYRYHTYGQKKILMDIASLLQKRCICLFHFSKASMSVGMCRYKITCTRSSNMKKYISVNGTLWTS